MQQEIAQKKLAHYKVKKGDSLTSIAHRFKTTITTLEKINMLHNGVIKIDQALLVPQLIVDAEKYITKQTTVVHAADEHTYIVKSGDNLHRLAAEFHTTTYHIMQHNHLKTATLGIGQRLFLPNA